MDYYTVNLFMHVLGYCILGKKKCVFVAKANLVDWTFIGLKINNGGKIELISFIVSVGVILEIIT